MEGRSTPSDVEAVALLDEPVRGRLYEWVSEQAEPVSRDEAAAALGITRALAAFHLDRLARAGLLETEFRRLSGRSGPGAGRPAKLYRRSARELEISLPARRYGLAAELFARAMDHAAKDESADPLRDVAHDEGLARGRRARRAGSAGPRGRGRLLRVLADGGYEPHVDEGGTIRLRNCPFHALVAQHRDLVCGMNLALAKGMVEGLGSGDVEPELDPQPGWCCVVFRPPESSPIA